MIAQKVTGNNYRRIPFEADIKAISDLQPLVVYKEYSRGFSDNVIIKNQLDFTIPDDFLYYVGCRLEGHIHSASQDITKSCAPVNSSNDEIYKFKGTSRKGYIFELQV